MRSKTSWLAGDMGVKTRWNRIVCKRPGELLVESQAVVTIRLELALYNALDIRSICRHSKSILGCSTGLHALGQVYIQVLVVFRGMTVSKGGGASSR